MAKEIAIILLIFIVLNISCEEAVEIDNSGYKPVMVIEGMITDQAPPYFVKVRNSVILNDSVNYITVNNAFITVIDHKGTIDTLSYLGEGVYVTNKTKGEVYGIYNLDVFYSGIHYKSSSYLFPVAPIDSITYNYKAESDNSLKGYYLKIFGNKTNENITNYYQLNVYKNKESVRDINIGGIFSDREIKNFNGVEITFAFQLNDTIDFKVFSLTKELYDYNLAVYNILIGSGYRYLFNFESNPKGNIDNGALGYFQTSAVSSKTIIIK